MQEKMEKLIKIVYKNWKQDNLQPATAHPDEEALVCLLEGKLSFAESEKIKLHLLSCEECAQAFAYHAGLDADETKEVPAELLARIRELTGAGQSRPVLEVFLKLKEKALELLATTGDVLVGQELVPAPVLRSRLIKDFKDEVIILKDFEDLRVEAKIENKAGKAFSLSISVKQRETQKMIKDLRVSLIKGDLEMESYLSETGAVTFEHVLLGKYTIEISSVDNKIASVLLDIKI